MTPDAMKDAKVKLKKKEDILDPRLNLRGSVRYNGYLMDRFDGDLELVIASYNGGPTRVERLARVPKIVEVQKYVVPS